MTTVVLIRHGEIVRPTDTSNFDPAPLTPLGRDQLIALAEHWPVDRPSALYSSSLRRAMESAEALADVFHLPIIVRPCLREWAADTSGIPQPDYVAFEAQAWEDLTFVPPSGESLEMAARRARTCIDGIAAGHQGDTIAILGHGTLFSLFTSAVKHQRPTSAYKGSIGFGHAAILRAGSTFSLVRDFAPYPGPDASKPL